MSAALTPEQEIAFVLVNECFGRASPEALRFCQFLIVEKQGLEWLDGGAKPAESESAQ